MQRTMREHRASTLNGVWACIDCYWKGRISKLKLGKDMRHPFHCPRCFSGNVHPACKDVITLTRYDGPIGTRN